MFPQTHQHRTLLPFCCLAFSSHDPEAKRALNGTEAWRQLLSCPLKTKCCWTRGNGILGEPQKARARGVSSDFFLPCAEFSTSAGEDVVQVMGKWPGAGTLELLGQNVASRVLEARGLSEEVLSVLKVVGFVFTEKPLQALVPRTVGTTHPWDIQVALVAAQRRARGVGRAESVLCRLHPPRASVT